MEARTLKEKGVRESRKIPYFLASILYPSLLISPLISRTSISLDTSVLKIFCFFPRNVLAFAKKKIANGTHNWIYNTGNLSEGNHTFSIRSYDGLYFSDINTLNVTIQKKQKSDKINDSPGFECILTFCALILILLYKWKKK